MDLPIFTLDGFLSLLVGVFTNFLSLKIQLVTNMDALKVFFSHAIMQQQHSFEQNCSYYNSVSLALSQSWSLCNAVDMPRLLQKRN